MGKAWDTRRPKRNLALQDELVRAQVRAVGSSSPFWRQRFADLGRSPRSVDGVGALAAVPAAGERDVSPTGDPAGMSGLVMQGGEKQFALHTSGPQLRRAIRLRITRSSDYQQIVDGETKPTAYSWAGLGFRYPIASTRGDLDVVARAGARLWRVLGLDADDALLSALPAAATTEHVALQYAALAAGTPALFPGDDIDDLVAAARLAPPTVLAVATPTATDVVHALGEASALSRVTTVLLVGAPTADERSGVVRALRDAGTTNAAVLAVHAPTGARVMWGECRESQGVTGLHTYPDLEVVQTVDPETGDDTTAGSGGELVLTQLGMRGSALLRWRTADLVEQVTSEPCPACGRTSPRVTRLRREALVIGTNGGRFLDLRVLAGALAGRPEITDWRVVLGGRRRDGRGQVVVHLQTAADPGDAAVGAAADLRAVGSRLPTQLVAATAEELNALSGTPLTARVLERG